MSLNKLELCILKCLWDNGQLRSGAIRDAILQNKIAYSTLSFTLRMMEVKRLIAHESKGNIYIYSAILSKEAYLSGLMKQILNEYFQADGIKMSDFLARFGFCSAGNLLSDT